MKIKKDINIKLSSLEGKMPSDVLSAKEFSKLLPFLPADIDLNSISGQYWTTKMINEYGSFYREPMKTLNDNKPICRLFVGGRCPVCDDDWEWLGITYEEGQRINQECCKNSYTPYDFERERFCNDSI